MTPQSMQHLLHDELPADPRTMVGVAAVGFDPATPTAWTYDAPLEMALDWTDDEERTWRE